MRVLELHSPVKLVQRSKGRTATAAAAYRSASRIECERTGIVHDYTRKRGVEFTALLLPDEAPDWAHDRAKLWNAAELREKHPRAQTAREMEVSFPTEFNREQRREAGLQIAQLLIARYGAAVDAAWHEPNRKGDERNHHAHFQFTTRRFENGGWAKAKDRTLDDLYGKGAEEITALRQGVAGILNNIAARDRLGVYVEHLNFEKRGLDQEPTQHVGPIATQMERRGVQTDIGNRNRRVKARNEQRRKLREEKKVVDIALERERLRLKQQEEQKRQADRRKQSPAPAVTEDHRSQAQPQEDPYAAFYREAQERRQAMLAELDRKHGAGEKELQRDIARLHQSLDTGGLVRLWRNFTGRTQQDKDQLRKLTDALDDIGRQRQAAHDAFERDRQVRLDAIRRQQEEARSQERQIIEQQQGIKQQQNIDRPRSPGLGRGR
jgi:hypothetical protein